MSPRRYLCSQLVALRFGATELTVNLEEIWESGAILECDQQPPAGVQVELRCGNVNLFGHLKETERHDFGWRAEIEFSPLTPWSVDRFEPSHMLDPADLG